MLNSRQIPFFWKKLSKTPAKPGLHISLHTSAPPPHLTVTFIPSGVQKNQNARIYRRNHRIPLPHNPDRCRRFRRSRKKSPLTLPKSGNHPWSKRPYRHRNRNTLTNFFSRKKYDGPNSFGILTY